MRDHKPRFVAHLPEEGDYGTHRVIRRGDYTYYTPISDAPADWQGVDLVARGWVPVGVKSPTPDAFGPPILGCGNPLKPVLTVSAYKSSRTS